MSRIIKRPMKLGSLITFIQQKKHGFGRCSVKTKRSTESTTKICLGVYRRNMGVNPKIGGNPQNGWFIMEDLIKMDENPYFWKHPYVDDVFVGCIEAPSGH